MNKVSANILGKEVQTVIRENKTLVFTLEKCGNQSSNKKVSVSEEVSVGKARNPYFKGVWI